MDELVIGTCINLEVGEILGNRPDEWIGIRDEVGTTRIHKLPAIMKVIKETTFEDYKEFSTLHFNYHTPLSKWDVNVKFYRVQILPD